MFTTLLGRVLRTSRSRREPDRTDRYDEDGQADPGAGTAVTTDGERTAAASAAPAVHR